MMNYNEESSILRKHTALGITAFVCSIIFVIMIILGLGLTSMYSKGIQENIHPLRSFATTIVYWTFFLLFVSLFLGIAGIKEEYSKKIFPTIAVLISLFGIIATVITILVSRSA